MAFASQLCTAELSSAWAAYVVIVVGVILVACSVYQDDADRPLSFIAWVASISTLGCLPCTLLLIAAHVREWNQPKLQLCVVRIVMMAPVYALDCWLAVMKRGSVIADAARECYEAFVIYQFVLYLTYALGGDGPIVVLLRAKEPVPHFWPLNHCLPQWQMGRQYLSVCKRGALQYVVLRLCTTALTCALALLSASGYWLGRLKAGQHLSLTPLLALLNTLSQGWAMYSLIMFYRAVRAELAPFRPLGKFLCVKAPAEEETLPLQNRLTPTPRRARTEPLSPSVSAKAVVFLTFWQSMALDLLSAWLNREPDMSMSHDSPGRGHWWSVDEVRMSKDGLLCLEMLVASLVHPCVFSASDYASGSPAPRNAPTSLSLTLYEALVPKDTYADMQQASWGVLHPRKLGIRSPRGKESGGGAAEGEGSPGEEPPGAGAAGGSGRQEQAGTSLAASTV